MNKNFSTRFGACLLVGATWCVFGGLASSARAQCNPEVPHHCDSCTCGSLVRCFLLDWHKTWKCDVRGCYNMGRLQGMYSPGGNPLAFQTFMYHPERYGYGEPVFGPIDAPTPPKPEAEDDAPEQGFRIRPSGSEPYRLTTRPSPSDADAQEWVFDGGVTLVMAGQKATSVEADQIVVQLPRNADVRFGTGVFSAAAPPQRVHLIGHVRMMQGEGVMVAERMELTPQVVLR